jgi:hypothetical protein
MTTADWRRSTYSGSSGDGNCVEVAWRTSSYSGDSGEGNCIEVGFVGEAVAVRDSKNRNGDTLAFDDNGWERFLDALR